MIRISPDEMLQKVSSAADAVIQATEGYEGLFPSVLDRTTKQMPEELPSPIPGQRNGDRSYPGTNLIHDESLLMTLYALSEVTGRKAYTEAADRYLKRFATHCTDSLTGLFPWGEHAYWDLKEDRVNDRAIHDHLRQCPVWLWDKLYAYNPQCVERFAEGLDLHWTDSEPLEYSRHADMENGNKPEQGSRSCDFPRHGGFYVMDWAFAYLKTGREDFLQHIKRMLDYWWTRRDTQGSLYSETRSPEHALQLYKVYAPGQTVSLGVSLLETASLLDDVNPEIAQEMRGRGNVYIQSFLDSPHDLEKGIYLLSYKPGVDEATMTMPVWGSIYGVWPASYIALICLCAYRLTQDECLFQWATSAGKRYMSEPFPQDVHVPAMDSGLALGLLADLYDISGEKTWLEGGLSLARKLTDVYMDGDLPRGAAGIDWYESQMGPGFLLHGLTRIASLSESRGRCTLDADYTAR